jgi:hypothetical protein
VERERPRNRVGAANQGAVEKELLGGDENLSSPVNWVEDERGNLAAANGSYFTS